MDAIMNLIANQGIVAAMFVFLVWWMTQRVTKKLDMMCEDIQDLKEDMTRLIGKYDP